MASVGEDVEKSSLVGCRRGRETLRPLGEQAVWQLLKSLTVEFLYDPAIPLVGVQPREMMTRVHANAATGTLRAPLFVTAERERQPERPSAEL